MILYPKQARGGVFRIYFCMALNELNTLILLCAKMKQYKELVKQGVMRWKKIKSWISWIRLKEKTNPSYKQLLKMAEAVGGDLFVTPMKNMTVLVPYDLQESVRKMSADAGKTTNEYLESVLRNAIDDVRAKKSKRKK